MLFAACGSKAPPPKQVEKPAPACLAVAEHVLVLVDPDPAGPNAAHAKKIGDIFMLRCEQDAWPPDARTCVMETSSLKDPKNCKSRLTVTQREALDRDLDAVETARESKLSSCDKYKLRIDQIATCDKLPQQARDALKQGFEAMAQGWAMHEAPEEARNQMEELCKQAVDALEQAVADMCGWR